MTTNFRAVTFLDTFPVLSRLYGLAPASWPPVEARGEHNNPMFGMGASILLRGHNPITKENWLDDLPVKDKVELVGGGAKPKDKPWTSMQRLLNQAKKAIMAEPISRQYLSGEMGRAMISRLDPGSSIFWHADDGPYHEKHVRFHLALVTNPGCYLYSQHETMHCPVGVLFYFNNRVRHSAANWGTSPRLHLILEMRRIQADADE